MINILGIYIEFFLIFLHVYLMIFYDLQIIKKKKEINKLNKSR